MLQKNRKCVDPIDVLSITDDCDLGYILEVDFEYPEELHNKNDDYQLAPEQTT